MDHGSAQPTTAASSEDQQQMNELIEKAAKVLSVKIQKRRTTQDIEDIYGTAEFPKDYALNDPKMSALCCACSLTELNAEEQQSNEGILQTILKYQPNVEHKDQFDRRPLHFAVMAGNMTAVKYLVETGKVEINAQTKGGETPLMKAGQAGFMEICKYLLEHGSDAKITNRVGMTAVDMACLNQRNESLLKLLNDALNY